MENFPDKTKGFGYTPEDFAIAEDYLNHIDIQ